MLISLHLRILAIQVLASADQILASTDKNLRMSDYTSLVCGAILCLCESKLVQSQASTRGQMSQVLDADLDSWDPLALQRAPPDQLEFAAAPLVAA